MKKYFSLTLVLMVLVTVCFPAESLALTYSANVQMDKNFSDFTTANSPALGGTDANSVLSMGASYKFFGGGSAAEFVPLKALFGKGDDDTSVAITRISDTETARMYGGGKLQPGGGLGVGEYIIMNWNWAFDGGDTERVVDAEFYNGTSLSYKDIKKFRSTSANADSAMLSLDSDGTVKFFGYEPEAKLSCIPHTWYNFEIRVINGDPETYTYPCAELYVDGIKLGTTDIKSAEDSYRLNGLGWFFFDVSAGTTYVDDLQIGYFRRDAANDMYTEMQQTFELTSKTDALKTKDNIHIDFKSDMTVEEFLADVTYNERTSDLSGITEVTILKNDMSEASASDTIENGWYARVKVEGDWNGSLGRNVCRYYFRKFTILKKVEITSFDVTSLEPGSLCTVRANLINNTDDVFETGVMVCVYNTDGGLESVKRVNLALSQGDNVLEDEVQFTLPESFDDDCKVKLFVTAADDYLIIHESSLE